ncbi:MAG: hypothetical protein ACXWC4_14715 [Telluria sp.]
MRGVGHGGGLVTVQADRFLAGWRFALVLAVLLAALLPMKPVSLSGDVLEYTLDTLAIATHGTPDITLGDIARGKRLVPHLAGGYELLETDMLANKPEVFPAFIRGANGKVYPIHFFGYPMMVAVPFALLQRAGLPPFKAFQVVNLAAVFVLGLALRRFFGSGARALAGVALFMLCGGWLYWTWSSPECVGAAALLSGMLLFCSGAPVTGAVLAGLAAQQNPTIVFFFAFAPPLLAAIERRDGVPFKRILTRCHVGALVAGVTVAALPPLFNAIQFGALNPIARLFSDHKLIGIVRLQSFYFDLNQGMITGIPAIIAALLLWGWRGRASGLVLALCAAFTLALALPALAVLNWNSAAAGIMRYAFWASMPFLFALLLRLRERARWPVASMAVVALVQAGAMANAASYDYLEFSPPARWLLAHAPSRYHPEPEIFAERSGHNDNYIEADQVYVLRDAAGQPVKTLLNTDNAEAGALLCGPGMQLANDNLYTNSAHGWRYIDGPVHCAPVRR